MVDGNVQSRSVSDHVVGKGTIEAEAKFRIISKEFPSKST
jgi:hypothetical protein